jgi:hypothetical protein
MRRNSSSSPPAGEAHQSGGDVFPLAVEKVKSPFGRRKNRSELAASREILLMPRLLPRFGLNAEDDARKILRETALCP